MKRLIAILSAVAALAGSGAARADWEVGVGVSEEGAEASAQVTYGTFHDNLQPYGQWDSDGTYGEVFYPSVQAGWRPYMYGRWVWTEYGWTWASEEPFGWATFHYGRWWWNPYRHAWGWVPGYEWAPAWVTWRYGSTAIGWAPLYVGYDTWVDNYPVYYDHWTYVPCNRFYGGPVYSYAYPTSYVRTTFYSTTVVTGYVGSTRYGPPEQFVQQHTATPIPTTQVAHSATPVQGGHALAGNTLTVYRPASVPVYHPGTPAPAVLRGPGAAPVAARGAAPVMHPSMPHAQGQGPQHFQPQPQAQQPHVQPAGPVYPQAQPHAQPAYPQAQPQQQPRYQPQQPAQQPHYQPQPQQPRFPQPAQPQGPRYQPQAQQPHYPPQAQQPHFQPQPAQPHYQPQGGFPAPQGQPQQQGQKRKGPPNGPVVAPHR